MNTTAGGAGIIIGPSTAGGAGVIEGNDIFLFSNGIWLQAGALNTLVIGNTLEGNTTAIANSGTNSKIVYNQGYNPVGPSAITVGASPFTYTAGASPETVYIWAGTVSFVAFDKNGGGLLAGACGTTSGGTCTINLGPYEQTKVTYTGVPNMNKMVH